MATIEPYETKAGRRYMVRYRTPDRATTKKRGFTTKRDAQTFASTVEVQKLTGDYVAPALGRITVGELAPDWLAGKKVSMKPSGYHSYDTAWRVHVQPKWADRPVNTITRAAVEDWITAMQVDEVDGGGDVVRGGAGAVVVLRAHSILAGILDSAVKANRLAKNPARGVENLPRKPQRPRTYLTHEQVRDLATKAGTREVLVYMLAYTGLRWGEATAVRVKHLDFDRRRIAVVENAVLVKRSVVVGTPKAHESRTVGLPAFLAVMLAEHVEGRDGDELVFPGADGGHQKLPENGTGWLEQAVKRSGVPRVTAHDLRHTAASLAVQAGAHVKAVQAMMGHKSAAMTLDVYSDLFDEDLDVVAAAMDTARGHILGTLPAEQR
ncbi:site-specific integrase [Tsukamurella serpentis]